MSMRNWFREPDPNRRKDEAAFRVNIREKPRFTQVKVERRQVVTGIFALCAVAVLMIAGLTPARSVTDAPQLLAQADTSSTVTLAGDCVLLQHMTFVPCGHEITRREALPNDLVGKTRTELEDAYDLWRVTSFETHEVRMEQQLSMYCPEHLVLMPDESGLLCVWQNTYGDALSLQRELQLPISDFDDETQSLLRSGLGFDSDEALSSWLENAES